LQEPDDEEDHDRRQVQPAYGGDDPADGAEHRLGQGIKNAQHAADEIIVRVDDIEGHQPAHDHRGDHDPFVKLKDFDQQRGDRVQHGSPCSGWNFARKAGHEREIGSGLPSKARAAGEGWWS
jgi:hypothetical protein